MRNKLSCILLIDDNNADNFIHEMALKLADCTHKIVAVQGGQQALDYLTTNASEAHLLPDLIFLDINMPAMNGWEFLDKYEHLDQSQKECIIVIMLTTSHNPDDEKKAKTIGDIKEFMNKPLTVEMIQKILEEHFPDRL